jgi:hypothetical protein
MNLSKTDDPSASDPSLDIQPLIFTPTKLMPTRGWTRIWLHVAGWSRSRLQRLIDDGDACERPDGKAFLQAAGDR